MKETKIMCKWLPTGGAKISLLRHFSDWIFRLALVAICIGAVADQGFGSQYYGANLVKLTKTGDPNRPVIVAQNLYYCPVEVYIQLTLGRQSTASEPPLPASVIVNARGSQNAVALRPANPSATQWSYRYEYSFTIGDPKAVHRPQGDYLPPFQAGQQFRVIRSREKGNSSDPFNVCSVALLMPRGTPVCAARDGIVADSRPEGQSQSATHRLFLLHADGTFGFYAHLDGGMTGLQPGSRIQQGQVIGRCGQTMGSDKPFLHFAVLKNGGMQLVSVPFRFKGKGGKSAEPKWGGVLSR